MFDRKKLKKIAGLVASSDYKGALKIIEMHLDSGKKLMSADHNITNFLKIYNNKLEIIRNLVIGFSKGERTEKLFKQYEEEFLNLENILMRILDYKEEYDKSIERLK